jgi:SPP1 gp7 family putative phage head morphogenesis protein
MQGVYKGFGGNFDTIAYNTPDYRKLAHLERNVYQFSGAKNWQMLRDLTDALRDGNKVLPFKDFAARAQTILDDYNGTWLRTEYNAAVAGSQMASKWTDFEQHPNALLEYRTAEDDRVRESHALLNGIIRPVDDDFWKTHYPPNGWNCRCTVIRLNSGKEDKAVKLSLSKPIPDVDIPAMFHTNLAQNGLVFPKGSAYFIGLPKPIKQQINSLVPDRGEPPKK